jgi:hypothetical protein
MQWRSNDRSMGRPHIRLAFTNVGQRNRVSSRACEDGEGPLAGRLITLLAVCVIDSVWLGSLGALRQPRDDNARDSMEQFHLKNTRDPHINRISCDAKQTWRCVIPERFMAARRPCR